MVTQQLLDYIKAQLQSGKTKEQITQELINGGWQAQDVEQGFISLNTGMPTPPVSGVLGPLPSVGSLFSESMNLATDRVMVMFLSYLLPILGILASLVIGGLLTYFASKTNPAAGIIVGIILGICIFVTYIYGILLGTTAQLVALRDAPEKTGVMENLKRSRPLIGSLFLVNLITGLIGMGGFVLLIIPGIMFMVWYGFAAAVMVTENKKGMSAVAQSKAYVYGRSWGVFGRLLLLYVIYFVPYIILQIAASATKGTVAAIFVTILLILLQLFYTFYSMAFSYTLYKQLKNSAGPTNSEQYIGAVTGWTVWGAVGGVIIFVGFFASIVLLALNSARAKSRDAERLADVRQIMTGAELYYTDNGNYPSSIEMLVPKYLKTVLVAPTPADGECTAQQNTYKYSSFDSGQDFNLTFCLGATTTGVSGGTHTASYKGIK